MVKEKDVAGFDNFVSKLKIHMACWANGPLSRFVVGHKGLVRSLDLLSSKWALVKNSTAEY